MNFFTVNPASAGDAPRLAFKKLFFVDEVARNRLTLYKPVRFAESAAALSSLAFNESRQQQQQQQQQGLGAPAKDGNFARCRDTSIAARVGGSGGGGGNATLPPLQEVQLLRWDMSFREYQVRVCVAVRLTSSLRCVLRAAPHRAGARACVCWQRGRCWLGISSHHSHTHHQTNNRSAKCGGFGSRAGQWTASDGPTWCWKRSLR